MLKKLVGCVLAFAACGTSLFAAEERNLSGVGDPEDAVDRLHDRETHMLFKMVGHGSSSRWLVKGAADFEYTVLLKAQSRILKKEQLPRGRYKVVELHKFQKATDMLSVSKTDITLDLSTFDVNKFEKCFKVLCLLTTPFGRSPVLEFFKDDNMKVALKTLKAADGVSVQKLLSEMGLPGDQYAKSLVTNIFHDAFNGKIRPIEGKSFKFTYILDRNKMPISVTYTNEDGSDVTDDEVKQVLDRLNIFIDTHTVPSRKYRVGDVWPVCSKDIEMVFDPYIDGHLSGDITVVRSKNDPDGTWNLTMTPTGLRIVGDSGSTIGNIRLEKGNGKVDHRNCTIEEIYIEGLAKMNRVSSHHWLFQSRISGWSKFAGKLQSIRLK